MKVIVLWDNPTEQPLARNLVNVLKKIGAMLVYGKVNDNGVLLEDWQTKPKIPMECVAGPSPATVNPVGVSSFTRPQSSYSYEMEYRDGVGYTGPALTVQPVPSLPVITRELMRDLVRMFPGDDGNGDRALEAGKLKKRKPIVPQPNTTKTGVTVRDLDMWDDDDHEGEYPK